MTEQDSDEKKPESDTEESRDDAAQDSGGQDDGGSETSDTPSGVVVEGYETNNAPREQTQALLEADSPDDVEDDLIKEIEEERERRLDPDNRPDNTEVDNTKRVFVPAEAKFEDSEIDQDESLGQEGLAPVGGDKDPARDTGGGESDDSSDDDSSDDDSSDDDSSDDDSSDDQDDEVSAEPHGEPVDPKDDSEAVTSGSPDPTDSDSGGGKHKA